MPQPRARPTAGGSGPTSPTAGRTAASSPGGTHPSARTAASCAAPAPAAVPGAAGPPQPPCSAAPSGRSEPLAAALCLQQQQFKPQQLKQQQKQHSCQDSGSPSTHISPPLRLTIPPLFTKPQPTAYLHAHPPAPRTPTSPQYVCPSYGFASSTSIDVRDPAGSRTPSW